jgi:hypothetical protein
MKNPGKYRKHLKILSRIVRKISLIHKYLNEELFCGCSRRGARRRFFDAHGVLLRAITIVMKQHSTALGSKRLLCTSAAIRGPRAFHQLVGGAKRTNKIGHLAIVEHRKKAPTVVLADIHALSVWAIILGPPNHLAFRRCSLQW